MAREVLRTLASEKKDRVRASGQHKRGWRVDAERTPSGVAKARTPQQLRRVASASAIGTTIEWYDYLAYSTAAALVFGSRFFSTLSPASGTLAAFATLAVGFIVRPIGGILWGHFGDRVGRRATLIASLLVMGVATVGVGLLPTYD